MKIAARRRLAVGVLATTSAMLAGVLIAPSSTAAPNGVTVTPNAVVNTGTSRLVFRTTDANLALGGNAAFARADGGSAFSTAVTPSEPGPSQDVPGGTFDREGFADVNFNDMGSGLGVDGPGDAGSYNLSITGNTVATAGGGNDTCIVCFTILSPGPVAVTSVAPSSLRPNSQGNVVIAGNNFERNSRIEVLNPGDASVDGTINFNNAPRADNSDTGTVQNQNITTRTELRRRVVVAAGALPGVRDVRVTNLDGNTATCTGCFFVAGPSLIGVNPTGEFNDPGQGLTTLTFTGPNVAPNGQPRLEFVGNPQNASRSQLTIAGQNVRQDTNSPSTSITADFDLQNAAPGGSAYQPVVQGDSGIVNACDTCRFTVIQRDSRTPTLTSLDRSSEEGIQRDLRQGESATFVATGTNFSKGATLVIGGTGVTVTAVEFSQELLPNQFLVTLAAAADAPTTNRDVTARLTDGKTSNNCAGCLTITSRTPSPGPSASGGAPSPGSGGSPGPSTSPAPRTDSRYNGLGSPTRVLDTRNGRGPRRTGEVILDLSQRISDPNATSAVLNVTVTNPTARGFLVAYPNGTTRPRTSNVNFETNQTQANEVVVGLSANRRVSLFVDSASAHVIADLVGFFTTTTSTDTGRVTSNAPVRAFDSRNTDRPRRTGEVVVDLSRQLPSGSTDAILNVTVQGPDERGFVVAFPTGTTRPGTSNVNFERGQTQANEVITRVGTGSNAGRVSLFIDSAASALIVDVVGAVTPGNTAGTQVFTSLQTPTRALDTRTSSDGRARRSGSSDVAMPSSVPSDATGVVLNVTATNGTRPGFVTVFPAGQGNPGTSNVNFPTNLTQANEVITRLGSNRSVTLFVGGRNTPEAHLIVDVVGFLTESGSARPSGSPAASSPAASGAASPSASARPSASVNPSASANPSASVSPSPR